MADPSTGTKPIYDYPLSHPRPTSEAPTEERKEDETGEIRDITIDIYARGRNEDRNTEEERELPKNEEDDEGEEEKKDSEKPLLEREESVKLEIKPDNEGEDTATLPLPDKKKSLESLDFVEKQKSKESINGKPERKLPKYLFPITRIKNAWSESSNVFQFLGTAACIIFQTVGWFTCVGGIPFLSLVMLIIGCVYVNECNIQPNIPVYLIVSGVIGTIQHFIMVWTNYVPKTSKGQLKAYRTYCRVINGVLHLFSIIWFILGSVWVYGANPVDFTDADKDEYCHKTLYYFAFWILNLSYILLGLIVFLSMCFFICLVATDN